MVSINQASRSFPDEGFSPYKFNSRQLFGCPTQYPDCTLNPVKMPKTSASSSLASFQSVGKLCKNLSNWTTSLPSVPLELPSQACLLTLATTFTQCNTACLCCCCCVFVIFLFLCFIACPSPLLRKWPLSWPLLQTGICSECTCLIKYRR